MAVYPAKILARYPAKSVFVTTPNKAIKKKKVGNPPCGVSFCPAGLSAGEYKNCSKLYHWSSYTSARDYPIKDGWKKWNGEAAGVYIFHFSKYELLVGLGKNMQWWFKKNANLRGKRWKNGGKEEIFIVPRGNISFWKKKGEKEMVRQGEKESKTAWDRCI